MIKIKFHNLLIMNNLFKFLIQKIYKQKIKNYIKK